LIPIWVIGGLTHQKTRTLRLREAVVIGACGTLTVPIGAEIASHVGAVPLRVLFAAFLIATVGWSLARMRRGEDGTRSRGLRAPVIARSEVSRRGS
jgi:uncharacterized membrane protein YfcA